MTETALSRSIRNSLERLGFWVIRVQSGIIPAVYNGRRRFIHCAEPGTPDLFVANVNVWLEVKAPGGRLTPEQRAWHAKAARKGVRVHVVRSVSEALLAVRPSVPMLVMKQPRPRRARARANGRAVVAAVGGAT